MSDPTLGRRIDWRPLEVSSNPNESTNLCWNCVHMVCRACAFRHNAPKKTRETSGVKHAVEMIYVCAVNWMPLLFCELYALTQIKRTAYACIYLVMWLTRAPQNMSFKTLYKVTWLTEPEDWTTLTTINPNSPSSTAATGTSHQNQKLIIKKKRLQVQHTPHGWYNSP